MKRVLWGLISLAACGPIDLGPCFTLFDKATGTYLFVGVNEAGLARDRPDSAATRWPDGGGSYVSGAVDGGRLVMAFDGPMVGGVVPRSIADAGCGDSWGDYAFFLAADGGNPLALSLTVTVSDGGEGRTMIVASDITTPDAGFALPDRTFNLPLP